jgi:hypothetical protein
MKGLGTAQVHVREHSADNMGGMVIDPRVLQG